MNDQELSNSSKKLNSIYKSHSNNNKKFFQKSQKRVVINNQNLNTKSTEERRHSIKYNSDYIKQPKIKKDNLDEEKQLILINGNCKKNYVKSYTLDTLKKKYKAFEGLLGKENNIRKKRTFVKRNQILSRNEAPNLYIDSGGGGTLNYWKTTFQTHNDTYNSTYKNSNNNHLSLFNKSKNNEKKLLFLESNNSNKNKIMMNQKLAHYQNNNKLILNTKDLKHNSEKSFNFIVDLPKTNTKSSFNLKTEKNVKINKNFISSEKPTTINIYNNKINNINNIILNESDVNNGANSEKNFKINIENTLPNELPRFYSKIINHKKEKTKTNNFKINFPFYTEKKIKLKTLKKKNIRLDLSKSSRITKLRNKNWNNSSNILLIEKLSDNYTNKNIALSFKEESKKNNNSIEIRKKILKTNAINNDIKIQKKLKKIKDEMTNILFKGLSRKISNELYKGLDIYDNSIIKFDKKIMKEEEKNCIKYFEKKTETILKKSIKLVSSFKNNIVQIHSKSVLHYYKITPYESQYLFYEYIFQNYFHYLYEKSDNKKKINIKKNSNLVRVYNNMSQLRSENSKTKKNKAQIFYKKSLVTIYSFMDSDKIQSFEDNDKEVDNIILQIIEISKKFAKESKDKKSSKRNTLKNKNNNIILHQIEEENTPKKNRFVTKKSSFAKYDNNILDIKKFPDNPLLIKLNSRDNIVNKHNTRYNSFMNNDDNHNDIIKSSIRSFIKRKTFNSRTGSNSLSILGSSLNSNTNSEPNIINYKYNEFLINKEKIEQKYDQKLTSNANYFFQRKTSKKTKKRKAILTQPTFSFLKERDLFKNRVDYRTDQIKSSIKNKIKSPSQKLFFYIKEHAFKEFCELLERKNIDLNTRNEDNDTFLIYAVKCKVMDFVLYLIKKGIDINLENKYGNTALHYAFSDQNFKLADILLKNGADEFKMNVFGQTPWQCLAQT